MNDLIERIEAASGPDREIDLAIAEYAFDQRIPLSCYGGNPINYDPRMWLERHDWSPTASIDAALTLVPEGRSWELTQVVSEGISIAFIWNMFEAGEGDSAEAATPALALSAAALKARAYLKETNNAD